MNKVLLVGTLGALSLIIVGLSYQFTSAHPGNTSADGMHYCWTNCDKYGVAYGERHGHTSNKKKTAPATISTPMNTKQMEEHKASIRLLYWALYNRAPENESIVISRAAYSGDIRKVAEEMLASKEFREKNAGLFK